MKKLKLFALGLIGASTLFMTSCADDDDDPVVGPSLTVNETNSNDGVVDGMVTIEPGDSLHFEWTARDGDAKLETFTIERDGQPLSVMTDNGNDLSENISGSENETYVDGAMLAGNAGVYTFTITDRDGESEMVEIEVKVEAATTPLSAEQSFTWERMGGATGTGLSQFGLEWTSNSSTSAIIAEDAATTFVELDASTWGSITTKEGLVAAISAATPITEFRGVSATQSDSYDIVLATMVGTDVYIMHITDAVVTSSSAGTDITINGMYKM